MFLAIHAGTNIRWLLLVESGVCGLGCGIVKNEPIRAHRVSSPQNCTSALSQLDIAPCIMSLHVVGECPLACQLVVVEVDVGESWGLAQLDGDWA
jgi:hypothetical protein